ncbi:MAG: PDDEXK nuclease domain-containing protein [Burkholderiales bacterium]
MGGEDYLLDLLLYHVKLRRYVVIDLKPHAFAPGDVGQINLYLSAVDDLLLPHDVQPTIKEIYPHNLPSANASLKLRIGQTSIFSSTRSGRSPS